MPLTGMPLSLSQLAGLSVGGGWAAPLAWLVAALAVLVLTAVAWWATRRVGRRHREPRNRPGTPKDRDPRNYVKH